MVETGHFALVLAFALALVQSVVPLVGARTGNDRMMAVGGPVSVTGFALVALAFAVLTVSYARSDFSVANVWENSHSLKPFLYKITGTWGNHEGSMLLWVLILTFFGALVAVFGGNLPASLRATVLSVQGWIGAAFLLFILATSNPFARLSPAPIEGRDLNPILQDIGLAIHPPLLYLGYVGFSICFSFAVAALIDGRIDAAWARWVQAVDARRLVVPHRRHRHGLLLGLLRTRLGRLLVLGSGRECLVHAVAGWNGAAPLGDRHGEAFGAENLDAASCHPHLLAVAARHVPRAVGRADLGPRLRNRPEPRHLHPLHPDDLHRRLAGALCAARALARSRWRIPPDLARRRARPQQPVPDDGDGDGAGRHALSAGCRGAFRRQDFGRRAVLRPDLRSADGAAAGAGAVRAAARLEARRCACGGATPDDRLRRSTAGRFRHAALRRQRVGSGSARHRARCLAGARSADRPGVESRRGQRVVRDDDAASGRSASLGVRHGAGPSGTWPDDARRRRRAFLRD